MSSANLSTYQLRDTILFRNSEINKDIGTLTSRGTTAIVNLSHKSSHEARVVKILTVVALIFVPVSFVAVCSS
jgi:Mg2+ and Co2+ transporter CorA